MNKHKSKNTEALDRALLALDCILEDIRSNETGSAISCCLHLYDLLDEVYAEGEREGQLEAERRIDPKYFNPDPLGEHMASLREVYSPKEGNLKA